MSSTFDDGQFKKVTFQEMFVLLQVATSTADFFFPTLRTIAVNIPIGSFYLLLPRFGGRRCVWVSLTPYCNILGAWQFCQKIRLLTLLNAPDNIKEKVNFENNVIFLMIVLFHFFQSTMKIASLWKLPKLKVTLWFQYNFLGLSLRVNFSTLLFFREASYHALENGQKSWGLT